MVEDLGEVALRGIPPEVPREHGGAGSINTLRGQLGGCRRRAQHPDADAACLAQLLPLRCPGERHRVETQGRQLLQRLPLPLDDPREPDLGDRVGGLRFLVCVGLSISGDRNRGVDPDPIDPQLNGRLSTGHDQHQRTDEGAALVDREAVARAGNAHLLPERFGQVLESEVLPKPPPSGYAAAEQHPEGEPGGGVDGAGQLHLRSELRARLRAENPCRQRQLAEHPGDRHWEPEVGRAAGWDLQHQPLRTGPAAVVLAVDLLHQLVGRGTRGQQPQNGLGPVHVVQERRRPGGRDGCHDADYQTGQVSKDKISGLGHAGSQVGLGMRVQPISRPIGGAWIELTESDNSGAWIIRRGVGGALALGSGSEPGRLRKINGLVRWLPSVLSRASSTISEHPPDQRVSSVNADRRRAELKAGA